jgi:hypothetical protein
MKKIIYLISAVILILAINACGPTHGNDENNDTPTNTETEDSGLAMEEGKAYKITASNTIVRNSNNTIIILKTDIRTGETNATLESGSARIK